MQRESVCSVFFFAGRVFCLFKLSNRLEQRVVARHEAQQHDGARRGGHHSLLPVRKEVEPGVSPAHIGPSNACHRAARPRSSRATHDARTEHSVPNKSVALSASACQVSKH